MSDNFQKRKETLKHIRNKLLRFHKILLDWDRAEYEKQHGVVTSGRFLELLLSDERFVWLRTISTLIVRIDESFDLDDGLSDEMLNGFYEEIGNLFDESDEYIVFKDRLSVALPHNPEASGIRSEIESMLK